MRVPSAEVKRATVSAVVITYNSGHFITECLATVQWADEVIVVDSESADRTVELAEGLAQRVVVRKWEGFSEQKNFAASLATGDWILHIDADERISPALRDEILDAVGTTIAPNGFYLARQNFWLGYWIRHGGWYPDWSLRLYRRGTGLWEGTTHERVIVNGSTGRLTEPLQHYTYRSVQEHVERMILRSAPLEAREAIEQGLRTYSVFPFRVVARLVRRWVSGPRTALSLRLLYKELIKNRVEIAWLTPFMPLVRFLYMYVVRLGFLDGFPGFWVAVLSSLYEAVRLAKVWEHFNAPTGAGLAVDRRPVWEQSTGRV